MGQPNTGVAVEVAPSSAAASARSRGCYPNVPGAVIPPGEQQACRGSVEDDVAEVLAEALGLGSSGSV